MRSTQSTGSSAVCKQEVPWPASDVSAFRSAATTCGGCSHPSCVGDGLTRVAALGHTSQMPRFPKHIQEYLDTSPYGPFTDLELMRLAKRLAANYVQPEVKEVERDLLGLRMADNPTPRNAAVFNNAIMLRLKAAGGGMVAPVCPCGSRLVHFDVDGPIPSRQICDLCNAPIDDAYARRQIDEAIRSAASSQDPPDLN